MSDGYTRGKTYTELPVVEKSEEEKFNDLINILNTDTSFADTEAGEKAFANLTDEQLKELTREIIGDSYTRPVDIEDNNSSKKQFVFASVLNTKRDYYMRFVVTGVAAAIRQFLHEYTPTTEELTWTVEKQEEAEPFTSDQIINHMMVQMKAVEELKGVEEHLLKVNAYHAQILEEHERIMATDDENRATFMRAVERKKEIKKILHEIDNPRGDTVVVPGNKKELEAEYATLPLTKEDMEAEVNKYTEHITYLRYGITYGQYLQGKEAMRRLPATRAAAYKFENNKKEAAYPDVRADKVLTMPTKIGKALINKFFNKFFLFNTEEHVRSASVLKKGQQLVVNQENDPAIDERVLNGDIYHLTLAQIRAGVKRPKKLPQQVVDDLTYIMSDKNIYNTLVTVGKYFDVFGKITEGKFKFDRDTITDTNSFVTACTNIFQNPAQYLEYLLPNVAKMFPDYVNPATFIPPQDTFHRIRYYMEVNYDALTTITKALYPEREDVMNVVGLWKHFTGTEEEAKKLFNEFTNRQEDRIASDLYCLEMFNYVTIADTKENRVNMSVFGKNAEVLKRILDRHAEDRKLGEHLMANRIKERKAANIREHGVAAPSLKEHENTTMPNAKKYITAVDHLKLIKNNSRLPEEVARATKKLETYERYEETIKKYGDADPATLDPSELDELNFARNHIEQEAQMLEVPDDHRQINVFKHNAATNTMSTGKIYTTGDV